MLNIIGQLVFMVLMLTHFSYLSNTIVVILSVFSAIHLLFQVCLYLEHKTTGFDYKKSEAVGAIVTSTIVTLLVVLIASDHKLSDIGYTILVTLLCFLPANFSAEEVFGAWVDRIREKREAKESAKRIETELPKELQEALKPATSIRIRDSKSIDEVHRVSIWWSTVNTCSCTVVSDYLPPNHYPAGNLHLYYKFDVNGKVIPLGDYHRFIDSMLNGNIRYTIIDKLLHLVVFDGSEQKLLMTKHSLEADSPIRACSRSEVTNPIVDSNHLWELFDYMN